MPNIDLSKWHELLKIEVRMGDSEVLGFDLRAGAQIALTLLLCGSAFQFGMMWSLGFAFIPLVSQGHLLWTTTLFAIFVYVFARFAIASGTIAYGSLEEKTNKKIAITFTLIPYAALPFAAAYILVSPDVLTSINIYYVIVLWGIVIYTIYQASRFKKRRYVALFVFATIYSSFITGSEYIKLSVRYGTRVNIFIEGEEPRTGVVIIPASEGVIVYFPGDSEFLRYVPSHRITEIGIPRK